MSSCKIHLDNHQDTFTPGTQMKGRLECYFDDSTAVRGVKIRLQCKEQNAWTKSETYTDTSDENKLKTRQVRYSGEHYIIRTDYNLFDSGSDSVVLNSGHHTYPFSFKLPRNIPSTYNGPYGSIKYKLKGIVDRPLRFDYEDTCYFKVNAPIDFNRLSRDLQMPIGYSDEKTVCAWCCQGGTITMDVEIPKSAFTVGETVNIKVDVCNMSNSSVEHLNVSLTKLIKYRVTSPSSDSKEIETDVTCLHKHGVGAHGAYTYNLDFTVPEGAFIPNFMKCNLFDVCYKLKISCQMPSCTLNLDINVWDIIVGHIQLRQNVENNDLPPSYQPPLPSSSSGLLPDPSVSTGKQPSAPPLAPSAPIDPTAPSAPTDPSAPLKEDPPPSYFEAQQATSSQVSHPEPEKEKT